MNKPRPYGISCGLLVALMIGAAATSSAKLSFAQQESPSSAPIRVDRSVSRLELIAKTSRLLDFDYDVPELVVDNQAIVRATPIASDKVLLTALKPGIATITINDAEHRSQTLDVVVLGDVRALEMILQQLYPSSRIKAMALESGVVLTGTLARASDVQGALNVATEYFPQVHNYMKLPDSQLIAIEVQVYEVARSKVRELGIDWQLDTGNFDLNVSGALNPINNLTFGVVNGGDSFNAFLRALESQNLARLLDKPTLVTQNGRPAEFLEGGELPFQVSQGFGQISIEFRPFGTKLDVVPIVQGEGFIRLEVRAEVSEPSADLENGSGVSGFRVRRVNTGVDMKIGHTLVLAGDIREEVEARTTGIPGLKNMPYIGAAFRKVTETRSEIELVMMLTPRFVGEVDPSLMPVNMPGSHSVSPSDCELYMNGHIEVPRCGPDCGGLPNQPNGSFNPYQILQSPGQPAGQSSGAGQVPPVVKPENVSGFGFPTPSTRTPTPRTGNLSNPKFIRR